MGTFLRSPSPQRPTTSSQWSALGLRQKRCGLSVQSCVRPTAEAGMEPAASGVLLKSGDREENCLLQSQPTSVFAGRTKPGQRVSSLSSLHF